MTTQLEGTRLKGLDECRPGELFERRHECERDVFDRRGRGALHPPRPLAAPHDQSGARPATRIRRSEPLGRSTVLIVLAAALCAGLAAGLSG